MTNALPSRDHLGSAEAKPILPPCRPSETMPTVRTLRRNSRTRSVRASRAREYGPGSRGGVEETSFSHELRKYRG